MESYIATLEHVELSESLYASLQRKQPAWHFKKALASAPECEDNWYAFKEQFYALQARQWLRDRELESKEYLTEAEPRTALELRTTDSIRSCMELSVSVTVQKRRYVIWQQDGQTLLTVFVQEGDSDEQLLSEVQINDHQLSGINRIIETYQPGINIESGSIALDANLCFSNANSKGEIQGSYTEGEVFQRLAMTLDMLLGIPELAR